MNHPFTASRDAMVQLHVAAQMGFVRKVLAESGVTPAQAVLQLQAESGPAHEVAKKARDKFVKRTENVEFILAIGLSDYYFGTHVQTNISFEIKSDVDVKDINSFELLMESIESRTHIDCAVSDHVRELHFQVKRYPELYLEHTNEALLDWLDENIFPAKKSGAMRGTILVVGIQPDTANKKSAFNFDLLPAELEKRKEFIVFDEVALTYTDAGRQTATLHKLYPKNERIDIPLESMLARYRGN